MKRPDQKGKPIHSSFEVKFAKRPVRIARRDTIKDEDAPRQLKFLSAPENADLEKLDEIPYMYDNSAGKGVRVYVIDSGVNLVSDVSTYLTPSPNHTFAP